MTGYDGFSKSNNAVLAEQAGLMTATATAKTLHVSVEAVRAILTPEEWHHTGLYFNETDYYSVEDLDAETLARLKTYKPAPKTSVEYRANVRWLEWSGSRNHPKATEHTAEGILVVEKGSFYTFRLPSGDLRKKIGSNGTIVKRLEA